MTETYVTLANANTEGSTADTYSSSQEIHTQYTFRYILEVSIWEKVAVLIWRSQYQVDWHSTAASKSFSSEKSVYSTVSAKFKNLCFQNSYQLPIAPVPQKVSNTHRHKAVLPSLQRAGKTPHELLRIPALSRLVAAELFCGLGWQREGAMLSCKCHIWQWFWFYCWGRAGGVFLWGTKVLFFTFLCLEKHTWEVSKWVISTFTVYWK